MWKKTIGYYVYAKLVFAYLIILVRAAVFIQTSLKFIRYLVLSLASNYWLFVAY